jgi:hypothetical protein
MLLIIATLIVAYFAPAINVASGTLEQNDQAVLNPISSTLNFMSETPLTLSYSNLPSGSHMDVYLCGSSTASSACLSQSVQHFTFASDHGTFTVEITGGQYLVLVSTASGVTYSSTSPTSMVYSTLLAILAVVGLAIMIVGFLMGPKRSATGFVEPPQAASLDAPQMPEMPSYEEPPQQPYPASYPEEQPQGGPSQEPPWSEGGDENA